MLKRSSSFYIFCIILIFFSNTAIFSKELPLNTIEKAAHSGIHLTENEKIWLAQNHVVRVRVGNNPPLHFFDGQNKGISVDYLRLIAELVGFEVEFVHGIPWAEAIEELKNPRRFDVILTAKNTKERQQYMRFSDDYLFMPLVIFSRTNSSFISSINDLIGKTVAVEKSFVMQEKLITEYPGINLLVKEHSVESLQAIASGEADAYIGNLATSTYIIHKHNLTNLQIACPAPFDNHNQAFAVRNDWPEFVSILNKAIKAIPSGELTGLRNKWFNFKFEYGISQNDVFKWIGSVVGICLFFLLFFIYKNRLLRVEIDRRKKVEEDLEKISCQQREVVKAANVGLWDWNLQTNKVHYSKEWKSQLGYTDVEISDARKEWESRIHPEDLELTVAIIEKSIQEKNKKFHVEFRLRKKNGSYIWVLAQGSVFEDKNGEPARIVGSHIDITAQKQVANEKKELENRLQQAQKMEAIGTLAGGIAHDFNNLLGVILGYAELAKEDAPPGTDIEQDLEEILGAANRAKDLVKQILAFSRQSQVELLQIKIQPLIKESLRMLRSSLPTTISITEDIDPRCGTILADPSQVNQIFMNLCTNAYHAMETTGGTLSVALKTTIIKPDDKIVLVHLTPGEYVHFTVTDTGIGMSSDVLEKIFDPYFTTKEVGKGTGMGLAIIHGIMKDRGGAITVESQLDKGSTFHVYFPVVKEDTPPITQKQEEMPRGKERVLLIDDEKILADMGRDMLERLGYHVTVRYSSSEALKTFQKNPDEFDLVVTDQTMPEMTGTNLAQKMLQIRPMIPIILCTGYSSLIDEDSIRSVGIKELAFKPIAKGEMAKLIRKVLDVA